MYDCRNFGKYIGDTVGLCSLRRAFVFIRPIGLSAEAKVMNNNVTYNIIKS